jgi:plasmid stabilization system protein ParE
MTITYHPSVQRDVNGILEYYNSVSARLADEFWEELMSRIEAARKNPEHFHLSDLSLRRANLQKFPYHFLFRIVPGKIRVIVVRHNRRHPGYGLGRE